MKAVAAKSSEEDVYIGRSDVAMWIRVISSWICMLLYMWSLLAPALLPDKSVQSLHRQNVSANRYAPKIWI